MKAQDATYRTIFGSIEVIARRVFFSGNVASIFRVFIVNFFFQ